MFHFIKRRLKRKSRKAIQGTQKEIANEDQGKDEQVILGQNSKHEDLIEKRTITPALHDKVSQDGKATALMVCTNFACQAPVVAASALQKQLANQVKGSE